MTDPSTQTAQLFSKALQNASVPRKEKQKKTRCLLAVNDSLERMVTGSVLREAVVKHVEARPLLPNSIVLFMDRLGGGEGSKAAATVIELLGERFSGISFIHVAFATPSRGIGTLMRSNLARKGADSGVLVDMISHQTPAEALNLSSDDTDELLRSCSLSISYAPEGSAGLIDPRECSEENRTRSLLHQSDIAVLAFPDPERATADLDRYDEIIKARPGIRSIRFWMQFQENNKYVELGHCRLGPNGDAREKLWVLLDNAKRHRYRILIEPMANDLPIGLPLYCPCPTILENPDAYGLSFSNFVKAGSNIVAVHSNIETP